MQALTEIAMYDIMIIYPRVSAGGQEVNTLFFKEEKTCLKSPFPA